MDFQTWLTTMLTEKGIDVETFAFEFEIDGWDHYMPIAVVIEYLSNLPARARAQFKLKMVALDFANGDVLDFVEYVARGIASGQI